MSPLLSREKAASYLGVHYATLTRWARTGTGPAYIKVGTRVRYKVADLDAYLAQQTCEPVLDHNGRAI